MAQYRNAAQGLFGIYPGSVPLDQSRLLFGTPSMKFDGVGYLQDPQPFNHFMDVNIHTGDFSIDGWAFFEGVAPGMSSAVIVGKAESGTQSFYLGVTNSNQLYFTSSSSGSGGSLTTHTIGTVPTNTWFHFEATRSGNTFYGFINGQLGVTAPINDFYYSGVRTTIGRIQVGGFEYQWVGNIRELRITRVARHTANFAVPTSPPPDGAADPLGESVVLMIHGNELFNPNVKSIPVAKPRVGTQVLAGIPTPVRAVLNWNRTRRQVDPWSGVGRIIGTVKEKNTPVNTPLRRRVWLLREREGQVVAETVSDAATGTYEFKNIDISAKYSVIAYDHEHEYRAVIADNLSPEKMT